MSQYYHHNIIGRVNADGKKTGIRALLSALSWPRVALSLLGFTCLYAYDGKTVEKSDRFPLYG
ncbi:hypothetical protein [Enterobacter asburiae]